MYVISCVEQDLGFLATSGLLPAGTGKEVGRVAADLCRSVAPHAIALCDSFGLTDEMLSAPIARDWVEYNTGDNRGEITDFETSRL